MHSDDAALREGRTLRVGLGAATCAWSLAFAALHLYWAAGGREGLGVEAPAADAALSQPSFFAYNVLVGVMAVVGAAVAVMLVRRPPAGIGVVRAAAWAACVTLSLRGAVGLVGLAVDFAGGGTTAPVLLVAIEPWFLLGGLLYGALALVTGRHDERRRAHRVR